MKKILISIKPQYVEKILKGTKKYEFRTKVAKQDINSLIIYSTYPTKKVVGEAQIIEIIEMTPDALWEKTKEYAGISKKDFDIYFKGREKAYAYKLGEIKEYNNPRELQFYNIDYAPQSFVYI